jgi:hypothetical protein
MGIPSRQIGWGQEENLLYQISKQLERLTGVTSKLGPGSTTTTTSSSTSTSTTSTTTTIYSNNNVVIANIVSNQSIPSGSDQLVNFTALIDPNDWFINDGSAFQPNVAGYYNVSYSVLWSPADSGGSGQINTQIHLNGGNQIFINQSIININDPQTHSGNVIVYLNGTSDYITVTAYSSANGSDQVLYSGNGTIFTAFLI